ncbi:hypothetical protein DYB34_006999 [Aphanomyces astaci]|uniref:Methyltransferase domain-containing protein n=1 Tax=Aphanomyces astaci TaxID=112090 RepID=A0A418C6H9_APHAT|nr:hypothetical protein DYB34_006999 [Aphanomyces astaci]
MIRRCVSTIRDAKARLVGRGLASSDVTTLLSHAHDPPLSRESLYLHPDKLLLTSRRLGGEPLAYVVGVKEFWSLPFKVTSDTLIPRPDSELLIETLLCLHAKDSPLRILDIGTGSGCLLVAALTEFPSACGVAIDISPAALAVAQTNATTHDVASRATFIEQDLRRLDNISHWSTPPPFDIVLCNPPYISVDEIPHMDTDGRILSFRLGSNQQQTYGIMDAVVAYEPHEALFAAKDGLALYSDMRHPLLRRLLRPGGHVLFEVGFRQAQRVCDMYLSASFQRSNTLDQVIFQDIQGIDRVVVLQSPTHSKDFVQK